MSRSCAITVSILKSYVRISFFPICSDLQKICLTGKRQESGDRKAVLNSDTELNSESLPFIVTASNGKKVSQKLGRRRRQSTSSEGDKPDSVKNRQDVIRTAPELAQDPILPCMPSIPDLPHKVDDKLISHPVKHTPEDDSKRFHKERIRLPKFQWTECHVKNNCIATEKTAVPVKVEMKEKPVEEALQSSDSDENAIITAQKFNSKGNLHIGGFVLTAPSSKPKPAHVTVGKCEIFSSTNSSGGERVRKSYETARKLPCETAFIRVLGHQTGPPPKSTSKNESKDASKERPNTKDRALMNQNLPIQYLTRFGRRKFHHVLEARSFKPSEKKLGAPALAHFHH